MHWSFLDDDTEVLAPETDLIVQGVDPTVEGVDPIELLAEAVEEEVGVVIVPDGAHARDI